MVVKKWIIKTDIMAKLIYTPKGAAREYEKYACNIFTGCSGRCTYCYNRKWIPSKVLGADNPTIKKSWSASVFETQLLYNICEHRKHGIFFSFVSDPFLTDNYFKTWEAIGKCMCFKVPVIILTKQAWWVNDVFLYNSHANQNITFGFTLTGHDEMEPGCATNEQRIRAMMLLKEKGFRTWASIEPIIDFESSLKMIEACAPFCDHFKIGLKSGWHPGKNDTSSFVALAEEAIEEYTGTYYLKQSIREEMGITDFEYYHRSVNADFNMFAV